MLTACKHTGAMMMAQKPHPGPIDSPCRSLDESTDPRTGQLAMVAQYNGLGALAL